MCVYFSLSSPLSASLGRTGRFGRKGVSINFVHNRESWELMNGIEQVLSCQILRVATDDLEEMEATVKRALKT